MRSAPVLLVLLAATSGIFAHEPVDFDKDADAKEVARYIFDLMDTLRDIQLFELGSIPSFFPIDMDFFEIMDELLDAKVGWSTVANIRNSTLTDVSAIQKMFYKHGTEISQFVELLAETVHLLQAVDKDPELLAINTRAIVRTATGLVSGIMTIVERIELNSATFQLKVDQAMRTVKADTEVERYVADKVLSLTSSYSENYEGLYDLLEAAHENFDRLLPALRYYITMI